MKDVPPLLVKCPQRRRCLLQMGMVVGGPWRYAAGPDLADHDWNKAELDQPRKRWASLRPLESQGCTRVFRMAQGRLRPRLPGRGFRPLHPPSTTPTTTQ